MGNEYISVFEVKKGEVFELPKDLRAGNANNTVAHFGYDYYTHVIEYNEYEEEVKVKVYYSRENAIKSAIDLIKADWFGSSKRDYYLVDCAIPEVVAKVSFDTIVTIYEEKV